MPRCGLWVHRFHQDWIGCPLVQISSFKWSSEMWLLNVGNWNTCIFIISKLLNWYNIYRYDVCFPNLDILLLTLLSKTQTLRVWEVLTHHVASRSLQVGLWFTLDRQNSKKECDSSTVDGLKGSAYCLFANESISEACEKSERVKMNEVSWHPRYHEFVKCWGWKGLVTWLQLMQLSCIHRFHGIRHFAFLPLFVAWAAWIHVNTLVQGGDD